ncbi:MAG: hypothetical protein ACOCXM_04680 [Myxococcota bacterium]
MISWFASDFFARSPVLLFPVVALALFVTVFMLVSLRTLLWKRQDLEAVSRLPLEEDSNQGEAS